MTIQQPKPPLPSIGVAAVVFNHAGHVLLIERNQAPAKGYWSIPGGKQEACETLAQACRREVKEETGLSIALAGILAVVERRTEGYHYVIIDFLAQPVPAEQNNIRPATDVSQVAWVHPDQLTEYPLVPGLADIIQRAQQHLTRAETGLLVSEGEFADYICRAK